MPQQHQKRIATWNSGRDCWETDQVDLLSGLSDVFSEAFTISGSMRNCVAYEHQMSAPLTDGSGSLFSQLGGKLLPTATAQDSGGSGGSNESNVALTDAVVRTELGTVPNARLLPTPRANEATGIGVHGTGGQVLRTTAALLPTPDAYAGSRGGAQDPDKRRAGGRSVALHDVIEKGGLLPTPKAGDADFGLPCTSGRPPEKSRHLMTRLEYTLIRSDEFGDSKEGRPVEGLQDMRGSAQPEEICEREIGRPQRFPQAGPLLADMRKQSDQGASEYPQVERQDTS